MERILTAHEPLLVNTIGHAVGALLFALALHFLSRSGVARNRLALAAAGLAFTWNLTSLLVLAAREAGWPLASVLVAVSTSALSLLPAVLLHLSLGLHYRWTVITGYAAAGLGVLMHATEEWLFPQLSHRLALWITTASFGTLTLIAAAVFIARPAAERGRASRLVAAMAIFLLSISLVHAGSGEAHSAWSVELLVHHAGVPLALLVLLQNYRFVLLDAFLRVLAALLLAAAFLALGFQAVSLGQPVAWPHTQFWQGILIVGACLALAVYALLAGWLQRALTRILFGRPAIEQAAERLRAACAAVADENGLLERAGIEIARFLGAERCNAPGAGALAPLRASLPGPTLTRDLTAPARDLLERAGVEAVIPIRPGADDGQLLLLGRRSGGRRYFSEDLQAAERLAAQASEHLEHFRQAEMRRLMAQAELRALESQIHPHFLFNALNTLYGVIPREADGARRTVLNLADIFRYFLQPEKTFIPLEEELRIVEAYLEIEALRLGSRLRTRVHVDPDARRAPIPVLTLQPIVENAVKHAVAARPQGGEVAIEIHLEGDLLRVRVTDTGPGFGAASTRGHGVGLANVARRLQLCYGPDAGLRIHSSEEGSAVEFTILAGKTVAA